MRGRRILAGGLLTLTATLVSLACGHEAPSEVDAQFVAAMVPHHRLGVELLVLAEPRVEDVRVRRLVFEMAGYHDLDLHHLEHYLTEWSLAEAQMYPGWIAPERMRQLAGLSGAAFDLEWLRVMAEHHEGALAVAGLMMESGTNSTVKRLAAAVMKQQTRELDDMQKLVKEKSESNI
jgi:uncharacterized protein (DUF305 family)